MVSVDILDVSRSSACVHRAMHVYIHNTAEGNLADTDDACYIQLITSHTARCIICVALLL